MKYTTLLILGTSLATAIPGFSQTAAEGFYADGFVQAEYNDIYGFKENSIYGDITLGYAAPAGNSLAWGIELSVEAIRIDDETQDIWNPIVFVDTDFGHISFGAPESAYEAYGLNGFVNDFGYFSMLAIGVFTGTTADLIAIGSEEAVTGISCDGALGQTRFGLSYHNYSEGSADIDMFAAAVRHSFESLDTFATYETTDLDYNDLDRYVVGAEGNVGRFGYGIAYANGATISEDIDSTYFYLD